MNEQRIREIERELAALPQGNLVHKKIKGRKQPYLQWTENGKSVSKYVKTAQRETVLVQMERKQELQEELKALRLADRNPRPVAGGPYKTHAVCGEELFFMTDAVKGMERRDCFAKLHKFVNGRYDGRVCVLYGLRRTGKTTLLLQMIAALSKEDFERAVYLKARTTDTMADVNRDLKRMQEAGYKYIFIDEVTLIEDFIDSASLLSDIYAMMGMRIVLSGTDSLGFWLTLKQELYDRAFTIHTTYIPFREYRRLLGIDDIDMYIRYGGTLRMGETDFDDDDLMEETASFRDDESTRRYVDTAICNNIQHSLSCCKGGTYLRHLIELYEAGELTGAINRIIEDMNHRFLLSVLTGKFKSHDLGSAAELLRKAPDPAERTDILDRVDRAAVAGKLAKLLEIREKDEQTIGITKAHIHEIKEYLRALDLIVDCPVETASGGEPIEHIIFTQPGMRYAQAQALVHVLMKDPLFAAFSERERGLACEKILEDVRGRMMEELVLLETHRSLPKGKRAFKLVLSGSEFDMAVYDEKNDTCELFEIKHSGRADEHQYQVLTDEEDCQTAEKKCGKIVRKCVIYRGSDKKLNNGVEYRNVESYLASL